jgi:hypothetical protein
MSERPETGNSNQTLITQLPVTKLVSVSNLQHVLLHADIASLGSSKGAGTIDCVHERVRVGKIDTVLSVQPVATTQ